MSTAPRSLWGHRDIIRSLMRREIDARFRGTFGGVAWYVLNNLALLALYTLVFGIVFDVRWPGARGGTGDFALRLFVGLILFNLVSENLVRAPTLIVGNANYVKKIVFPLEVLPIVAVGATLFNAAIAFAVLLTVMLLLGHPFHPTILLAPLVLVAVLPWLLGASWILASLGVFVRDIGQVLPLVSTALLFLSPVFFPRDALPPLLQVAMLLNPLSAPIEAARDLVLAGRLPPLLPLVALTAGGLVLAAIGLKWFRLSKRGFADVL
jgi:lipopolysaccharide transport system permease protein